MKQLIAVLAIILTFGFTQKSNNTEMQWQSWNEGFPKADQENKIALIDTYTDWCGWCKRMDANTYSKSAIIEKINKDFIPIKFNPELDIAYNVGDTSISGRALLGALSKGKSTGYPTTYFYVPSKNVMYQYPGYMDSAQFTKVLDEVLKAHKEASGSNP